MPGAVADEERPSVDGGPQPVRDPVALEAHGGHALVGGQPQRGLLDLVVRVERAHADAQLAVGGEAPRVPRAHVARIEPELEVRAVAVGVDLEAA